MLNTNGIKIAKDKEFAKQLKSYSPDFAYVLKFKDGEQKLHFIVETKNYSNESGLGDEEKFKIKHAEKFFGETVKIQFKTQFSNNKIVDLIKEISVNEIKLAFEMCARNEINVNMVAYYGKFNVSMLGDILTEYIKRRNNLIIELENEHKKNLRGETFIYEKDHKNFIARQEVIKEFKTELDNVKNNRPRKYNSFEEIRIHWPKILIDNGIIQLDTETKSKLWEQAKFLVKRETQKKAADVTNFYEAKHNRALLKSFEDAGNHTFQSKCDAIYSKLFVWEFLK